MKLLCGFVVFTLLLTHCMSQMEDFDASDFEIGGKKHVSKLLDVAKDFVTKTMVMLPTAFDNATECGREKSLAFLDVTSSLITEVRNAYPECPEYNCSKYVKKPMDCSEVLRSGKNESGVYKIWPRNRITSSKVVEVYCDMETLGGGWTVIQRRGNFSTPKDFFMKDWQSYKKGFGNPREEFWLGNDNIYAITNQDKYKVRFDLVDTEWDVFWAEYDNFWVEDESHNYTLHINGHNGNTDDNMKWNDNCEFSTIDRENGKSVYYNQTCTEARSSAWWHNNRFSINESSGLGCTLANLNGLYQQDFNLHMGITWFVNRFFNLRYVAFLQKVEIKVRAEGGYA